MATKKTTPPAEEILPSSEEIIDEFMSSLDNAEMTDEEKEAARIYLASRLTKYGFAVIKIQNLDGDDTIRNFSAKRLFEGTGGSKRPTLMEIRNKMEHDRQKFNDGPVDLGDSTASEFVEKILSRAGVPDSEMRADLKQYFTRALKIFIPSPYLWQNRFKNTTPDDVA